MQKRTKESRYDISERSCRISNIVKEFVRESVKTHLVSHRPFIEQDPKEIQLVCEEVQFTIII